MKTGNGVVRFGEWTLLTMVGLSAGLIGGLLVGMSLKEVVNAMIITGVVTCVVGGGVGGFQAVGLRRLLGRPVLWTVATIIGIGVGLAAAVVLVEQVGILATGERPNLARLSGPIRALSFVTVGLITGGVVGVMQWVVLRRGAPGVKHWIPASAIALGVAFAGSSLLIDVVGLRIGSAAGAATFVIAAGFGFGALSAWPLRRASVTD
jgi:hypothetical protein